MQFIEMTGRTLRRLLHDDELPAVDFRDVGLDDESIVRVNRQGDIELRRPDGWEVIGGLLGNYEERIRRTTGLDWA